MREFEITLDEEEANLLIELLLSRQRFCRKNADNARNNGYGTATSLNKAEEWSKKEDYANELCSKLSEKMI